MPQFPIPNDWDNVTWECVMIEWPFSEQWFGILRGLVTTPLRGRFWDGLTGNIKDAQTIGLEIEERNPVTTCEDIVAALQGIQVAVENLDISADLQVGIQTNIENNISLVSTAIANSLAIQSGQLVAASASSSTAAATAFAWSKAIAENTQSITIIANFQNQFRPISPTIDNPPQPQEEGPTGISATLESAATQAICNRCYWLVRDLKEFLNYLDTVSEWVAGTVLSLSGMMADALWAAALKLHLDGGRFMIPASTFLSAAHKLQEILVSDPTPFGSLSDWIDSEYPTLVCELATGVGNNESTEQLQSKVISSMQGFGVSSLLQFLPLLLMNYSSLAALYYVAPGLPTAPAIPASEPADICDFCDEE